MNDFESVSGYLMAQLSDLCARMHEGQACSQRARDLFFAALRANCAVMDRNVNRGMTEPVPASTALLDFLGEQLVSAESQLFGVEHVQMALDFAAQGGNVLMIQNHTSGADTLVWAALLNRLFPGRPADQFGYMAGHVVNFYLLPVLLSAGWRRFQIYSSKYKAQAEALGLTEAQTTAQNVRALADLVNYCRTGGRLIGLYPEGGRGEGALIQGDPRTAKIPEIIAGASPKGLMVLPTYVMGATSILPVVRGPEEFVFFMEHIKSGTSNIRVGRPMLYEEMLPCEEQIGACRADLGVDGNVAVKVLIHQTMMLAIAALAESIEARGPWAQRRW